MRLLATLLLLALGVAVCPCSRAEEPDDGRILEQIVATRDAILRNLSATNASSPATGAVFLAFWDFDGTILKGDCSEGLKDGERVVYAGLAQVAIEHGLSQVYPREGGFEEFWAAYENMDAHIGHWLAYPFIPQMLRGAPADEVLQLSRRHFATTLSNYLMASSVKLIRALERDKVECHIVSASADLFVKGAATSLGLPESHIHGIEVRIRDERLTEEIVYPVTWNVGKLEKLNQIVAQTEREQPGKRVFILAGFGDSYNTDGPFLKFIAAQRLPAGKPVSVFYDSKSEPVEYRGLFYQARHAATVNESGLK
jgi:phosphoserine phosphatase